MEAAEKMDEVTAEIYNNNADLFIEDGETIELIGSITLETDAFTCHLENGEQMISAKLEDIITEAVIYKLEEAGQNPTEVYYGIAVFQLLTHLYASLSDAGYLE